MRVHLLAIGKRMPGWVEQGFETYAKRLPKGWLQLKELPLARRSGSADASRAVASEGKALLDAVPKGATIVALQSASASWSTEALRARLERWMMTGKDVALMIGGPDGLSESCLAAADEHWSLSALTLPHGLVRDVVAEQLYRSWSMINNHPYHRD